jgi:LPS-assembly protein
MPPPRRSPAAGPRAALLAAVAACALAPAVDAQDFAQTVDTSLPVALVADSVAFDEAAGTVTASGDVEVYHGDRTLTAAAIVYDSRAERISAEGPIVLRDPTGATLVADFADLDPELRDGVIRGARALIADGAGRVAAVEGRRIDGRYNALSKAVYSACEVCAAAPTPLWAIRAERVVHDEVEKTVYYEDAVFEIAGTPVAWLPFFSHPDPTVRRKSGFLPPTFGGSTTYGYSAKIPYFWAIDPSRDATITPFLTTEDGPILEGEYRQRFASGGFDLSASAGWLDTGADGVREWRGHVFGSGRFDLDGLAPGDAPTAGFDLALASDKGYLRRYDFNDDPRLTNEAFVEDYGRRGFYELRGYYFQTLRDAEDQDEVPFVLPDFTIRRETDAPLGFGALGFEASGVALARPEGRNQSRLTGVVDWRADAILDFGAVVGAFAAARADIYAYADDPTFEDGTTTRFAPLAGVEAFYPLIARDDGVSHLLEPGVQFIAAPTALNPDEIANEDSQIIEFDETDIFGLNRAPGYDRIESGTRVNLGLRYARYAQDPLRIDASVGRVFRLTDDDAFSVGSGLAGDASDIVGAWSIGWGEWISLSNRLRLSDEFDINRNELRGAIDVGRLRLDGSYVFLESDVTAGALEDRQEGTLSAALDLDRHWTLGGFMRRDLENDAFIETRGALAYRDECAALEFFVGRDFVETEDAPAATSFGVRVRIFGAPDGDGPRSAVCAAVR